VKSLIKLEGRYIAPTSLASRRTAVCSYLYVVLALRKLFLEFISLQCKEIAYKNSLDAL
jgi:hypothetical protein